jgi:predicted transcriptional regulator of viral defense system
MPKRRDIESLGRLAARQAGRVTRAQLHAIGFSDATVDDWTKRGLLIRRLPKVYAFGHAGLSHEARRWEAILYAGPGAMLSHMTAAQWCGYIKYAPTTVHVSTPRKITSLPSIVVHPRRDLPRQFHDGLPVTTLPRTLLDLALQRPDLLERALSQADFMGVLDRREIEAALRSGNRGAAALRTALDTYDPNFARLNDEFEIDFYALCREWGIEPLPTPNVEVAPKLVVDALWPEHHLGVELDGGPNHSSPAQLLRDAERDLTCRRLGLTIIRYRRAQVIRTPDAVRADLEAQLAQRSPHGRAWRDARHLAG